MSASHIKLAEAFAFHQADQIAQAKAMYEEIVTAEPSHAGALHLLGVIAYQTNNLKPAIELINKAIAVNPSNADFYASRGNVLYALNQLQAAVKNYDCAIGLRPDNAVVYFNRGIALTELKQLEAAVESYDCATKLKPDFAEVYFKKGLSLQNLKQFEAAILNYDYFSKLKPNHVEPYINRGNSLRALGRLEESVDSFNQAIAINPNYADAYFNRGLVLHERKEIEKAVASYDQAIAINPEYAEAYWMKSLALLCVFDFEKGWELNEWRFKSESYKKTPTLPITNQWDGKKLAGSLIIFSEQGLGDKIFFSSMLNDISLLVDHITVCIDERLIALYQRSFEHIEFIPGLPLPDLQTFDAQIYMPDLGRYCRPNVESLHNIKVPYLEACPTKTQHLRNRLSKGENVICGLSWISKNMDCGPEKTLRLNDLLSVLSLPTIDFVDLQYGDTRDEQNALYKNTGIKLKQISDIDNTQDIDGLAALINACDIVLTISNVTAHLAGALGKDVIIMVPYAKGLQWYWHDGNGESPWYPAATLYRQDKAGDWEGVIARVRTDLENRSRPSFLNR